MSETLVTPTEAKLPKDLAAEKGMVNVQIDGVWHQFPRGTRMIEACRQAGVLVPHYCYHPKLSVPGNCRMCLVQMGMAPRPTPGQEPQRDEQGYEPIGWMPRGVIACANTVSENMGIRTQGELVEKFREGVMEFLLINHPLDCPICDQAGECRLQEFSVEHGRGSSRFEDAKVKKPKNVEIGPRVRLDDERCIMCSRCIRFMDEVAGDAVLGFTQRGTHTTLAVHPNRKLDSNYSLNTVDICPVGALTSNDFRFQMRVWFLKETKTIDINCGTGSNITIWTRGSKIFRITPRQNDDVNSCWMPDSHRLAFHDEQSEQRLTQSLVKAGNSHEAIATTEAISLVAKNLRGFAADEIAIIGSARQTNEELFLTAKLAQLLKTPNLSTLPHLGEADSLLVAADRSPNTTGAQLVWKTESPAAPLDAIRAGIASGKIRAVIALKEDLIAAGFTREELEKLALFVQLHTLTNPSATLAHVVLAGASFAEKRGSMVNLTGRLQRLNRALEPPAETRDDWEILRDLIAAVSGEAHTSHAIEDIFRDMAAQTPEFHELSLSKIGDAGVVVKETGYEIPLLKNERARTASGQING